LDVSLFDTLNSQTTPGDRRSLLAVQRAVANKFGSYTYLEIGSYMGGSIQPHLADERCTKIYSIDPRPASLPDDRVQGEWHYEENSTARMLALLTQSRLGDTGKIECFDTDAAKLPPERIQLKPQLLFIDGEHTKTAVLSDFRFCHTVKATHSVVLFHDFSIIHQGIRAACEDLNADGTPYVPLMLEGDVFAIFFDRELLASDTYLRDMCEHHRHFWRRYLVKSWIRDHVPAPAVAMATRALSGVRSRFGWPRT